MSASIDFSQEVARVKAATTLSAIISASVPLKRNGREFTACCPFHAENTPSFSVNDTKGFFHCFGCGENGDVFDWLSKTAGMKLPDAVKHLNGNLPITYEAPTPTPRGPAPAADWAAIIPVPDDAPKPPNAHPKHGTPTHVARYLNRDGGLFGLIYRCEPDGGKKQIVSLTYCQNANGRNEWRWQSMPKPRPLFGAELLDAPGRVLVVEGEPKAEAARRMLGDAMTVVAWPGGAQAVQHADWSMLSSRNVVIWPDADTPGTDAAAQIANQVRHHGATARIIEPPHGAPKGWDLADAEREGWSGQDILTHIDPPETERHEPQEDAPEHVEHFDFAPLGHDRGRFYFFTSGGGQVRDFGARDLQSIGSLCELAPLRYWELNHPGKGDAGFNVRAAGDALVRACYRAGIYDAERLRGRGAWLDEGRTVLHIGDKLIVNGVETGLASMRSRFIYEQGRSLSIMIGDEQLSSERASRLMDLCVACPWDDPASMGRLLAGWLVIAPVCGAMPWRPHIWVTGEAGSGKSWIIDNIIRPVVSHIALLVASKTSEAGVRGDLGLDARPVVFDEFESQNEQDRARVQQVLDLARQASSEDGAAIVKGTQTGGSRRYSIRSCFAFSSINLGLQQAADESRTVVLTVSPSADPEFRRQAFQNLMALHSEVMTLDFQPALLARTLSLLPTIRTNAEVFAAAIARSGVSRRTGDTIGVLLAGAWSLRSHKVATAAEADRFVETREWIRNAVSRSDTDPEWRRALDFMVQVPLRTAMTNRAPQDVPIGELIAASIWNSEPGGVTRFDAEGTLERAGVKVVIDGIQRHIVVANSSETLRKAFSLSPWASSWLATLARSPGSDKMAKSSRFGPFVSRGLRIPLYLVASDDG